MLKTSSTARSFWEWPLALLLIAVAFFWARQLESPISFQDGFGWDGVEYGRMAAQFAAGEAPRAEAPFVYRIGTPWLVAQLSPDNPLAGFWLLNLGAALVAPLLLFAWFKSFKLKAIIRLLMLASFLFAWHTPLRFTFYYPVWVDPLMWLWWLLGLLMLLKTPRRPGPIWLVSWTLFAASGAAIREVILLLPLLLALRGHKAGELLALWRQPQKLAARFFAQLHLVDLLPFAAGVGVLLLIQAWATPTNSYSFASTAIIWLYQKGIPHMLHGLQLAFSPMIFAGLLLALKQKNWKGFAGDTATPLFFALCLFVLGWTGGSDTERILYWAAPLLMVIAGTGLKGLLDKRRGWLWLALLILLEAAGQRWILPTPDYLAEAVSGWPVLTFWNDGTQYLDLYSFHGERRLEALSLAQYTLVNGFIAWLIMRTRPDST